MSDAESAGPTQIERTSPRAVFAQLVASALSAARIQPSPMATAYLVELLEERIREPVPDSRGDPTLAEDLLHAQRNRGAARIRRMRTLGDRALFVSGFFGDSLARKLVDIDYYMRIGRTAYGDVATGLASHNTERTWTQLYGELALGFGCFVDVLAEVGDRSRPDRGASLIRIYDRYLRTGSERDRNRLIRRGHVPPNRSELKWWQ